MSSGRVTNSSTKVASNAAPVGVVASKGTAPSLTGMPLSSSRVAGAGAGSTPCSQCTMPPPSSTGEHQHAIHVQPVQGDDAADDIHDGVQRAHFVKVDAIRRRIVNMSLGLGQPAKHRDGPFAHPVPERTAADDRLDLAQIAVRGLVRIGHHPHLSTETPLCGWPAWPVRHNRPGRVRPVRGSVRRNSRPGRAAPPGACRR